jgi:hypothetical protein
MGASIGAIVIKTDTKQIDISKVFADLITQDYRELQRGELWHADYKLRFDNRNKDCFTVGKNDDLIILINSELTAQLFKTDRQILIDKLYSYFNSPHLIFGFEEYDSGGSYGYSLIYDGALKRSLRSLSYEKAIEFGPADELELKWINAETTIEEIDEGVTKKMYHDRQRNFSFPEDSLPQVMLQELMLGKLGFTSWDLDEKIKEFKYFRVPNLTSKQSEEPKERKSIWTRLLGK